MRGHTHKSEAPGTNKNTDETRRSQDMYQAIFENAVEGIFQSTLGGRFLNVNPAMARMYGYASPQEMMTGVADITRQVYSDRDLYLKFVQLLKRNGKVEKFEAPNRRKDGTMFWTSTSARAVYGEDGHLDYYEGFVQDITETKRAENALKESETLYRQAMEASGAVPYHEVYEQNGTGYKVHYTFVGEGIREITGYGPEEFTDQLWDSLILEAHPLDELADLSMRDAVWRVRSGDAQVWRCEFKIRARDGSIRWVYETAVDQRDAQGKPYGSIGSFQDITERKLAEASLHESEQRSKIVTEMTTDYLFIVDVSESGEMTLRWASENMEKLTGRTVEKISSSSLWDRIVHPADLKTFTEFTAKVITTGEPGDLECRVFTEFGSQRWIQIFVQPQKVRNGRVTSIIGAIKDITERKKTEQALRESEEMLRSIFRVVPTGMGILVERVFTDINPRVCEMTGYAREELIGQSARMLYPTQEEFEIVGREKYGQIAERGTGTVETRWKKKDGTIINIILASTPIDNTDPKRGVTFTVMDITERKRSEDAMRAIAEVGRDISSTLHLDVVLHRIVSYARDLLNTHSSAVYLVEEGTSTLRAVTAIGDDAAEIMSDPVQAGEGILGNIVLSRWGEIVNETSSDPRSVQIKGTAVIPFEHLMGVPVMIKERLTGLIAVWRVGEDQEFKPTELDFLTSLAQQVAVAIDNARLFEETQHRLREMEAMVQVSATLSRTVELDPLLQEILETSIRAIPVAERGSILLADGNRNLNIRAVSGYQDPRVRDYSFPPNCGYAMKSFREQKPIIIPDVRADTAIRYDGDIREMLFNGSAIATPLVVKGKAIGVISIDTPSRKDAFTQNDLQLLTAMAGSAGLAIENARLFDDTRRRLSDLEILHSISSALRTASNLQEAQPILLEHLVNLMDAGGAALEILEPVTGEVVTQLAIGDWEPLTGMRMPGDTGISGFVVSTGQPYLSSDVTSDGVTDRPDLFFGLNCVACVPVNSQHSTIGTLWIGRKTPIREEEVSLLISIGEMVGNAINRMVLHEQTTLHLNRLNALHMIERVINSSLDINITLEILLEHVVAQLDAQAAGILLLNPRMFTLEYAASKGLRKDKILSVVRLGEDATSRVVLERSTISLPDLSEKRHDYARLVQMVDDAHCYHATPLIAKGQVRGVLEVFHREEHSPESEWVSFLQSLAEQAAIAVDNAELFKNLQRTNEELSLAYDDTISGWARALDLREKETANHSFRVTELTLRLAQSMGVDESKLQHIRRGALLHDIGKMGIPDAILLKQDVLTPEEWEMMKMHPVYSYELLRSISYLLPAIDIPHFHHEKWDGTGYPLGLKGEAIPQAARIFAVVDVWDALRSARPYRSAWPDAEVRNYLRANSGSHFDPVVVDIFLKMMEVTNPDWALTEIINH